MCVCVCVCKSVHLCKVCVTVSQGGFAAVKPYSNISYGCGWFFYVSRTSGFVLDLSPQSLLASAVSLRC